MRSFLSTSGNRLGCTAWFAWGCATPFCRAPVGWEVAAPFCMASFGWEDATLFCVGGAKAGGATAAC